MKKTVVSTTATSMNRDELVKDTSQPKMLIGTMRCISN